MTALLEIVDVRVRLGGAEVLAGVSLEAAVGTAVGLVGPNGAGKSTLLDAIGGFVPLAAGAIRLGGVDLAPLAPHRRARLGLGRTFQALELFEDLDVAENLEAAGRTDVAAEDAHRLPRALSHGGRKDLALDRALAGRPRVLLLDEPAAGLDQAGRAALVARLRGLVADGLTLVVADHDLDVVAGLCDRVHVLDFGRVIAAGPPASIRVEPAVVRAYLGELDPRAPRPRAADDAEPVLEVTGLSAGYAGGPVVHGVDLVVRAGEVVALLGPNGAGKTTTLQAVAGVLPAMGGTVTVFGTLAGASAPGARGRSRRHRRPDRLARAGMAFVPQDRGVLPSLTAAENLRLATPRGESVADAVRRFPALASLLDGRAGRLSGGEQQLLAVARAFARRPRLLLIDEITMGLAPRAARQVLDAARELADGGAGVLLAEQHPGLALQVADRAVVLARGRVVSEGHAADLAAHPDVLRSAYLGTV